MQNDPRNAPHPQSAQGSGGPVRSDDPGRDYFFEQAAAPPSRLREDNFEDDPRQLRRMSWRAAGVQDYPGGALDQLVEASHRAQSHRGKGPKGYRPSDARVREIICERLTEDPLIDASALHVEVSNGEVSLSGSVPTRRMKFELEELVDTVPGVSAIHNAVRAGDLSVQSLRHET